MQHLYAFQNLIPKISELFKTKTFLSCWQYLEILNIIRFKLCLFSLEGITRINKDFFNRVAPIGLLYTVVWFQFKFTKNPFLSKEELSKGELSRMCQHNTSRLRSQQPMVRSLYLQELNLRFYTSMSPSRAYFSFVHLGVVSKVVVLKKTVARTVAPHRIHGFG